MMRLRLAVAVVAVVLCSSGAARDALGQGARACATANAPTQDSVSLLLTMTVQPVSAEEGVSAEQAGRVESDLASRLGVPTPLGMEAYIGHRLPGDDEVHVSGAHLDLDALYGITLGRDGRVKRARVLTTSLNPALDRAMLGAIHAADSAATFAPLASGIPSDTIPLRVLLMASDSARARGTPILRARVPVRHLDRQLAPLSAGRMPRYPDELRGTGIAGRVDLSFVVDDAGKVIPATVSVRRATDARFARAVLAVFSGYRFTPAVVDGCAVPFHGAMPFEFPPGD